MSAPLTHDWSVSILHSKPRVSAGVGAAFPVEGPMPLFQAIFLHGLPRPTTLLSSHWARHVLYQCFHYGLILNQVQGLSTFCRFPWKFQGSQFYSALQIYVALENGTNLTVACTIESRWYFCISSQSGLTSSSRLLVTRSRTLTAVQTTSFVIIPIWHCNIWI